MYIPPDIEEQLKKLMRAFLEQNALLNLSALRTEDACWTGNILDSLALLDVIDPKGSIPSPASIIDVGTGGGFPLLPLAIALPQAQSTGIDAIRKKVDAVRRIAQNTGVTNAMLVTERSENIARMPKHRDHYDIVTARAVAPINILLEYTAPFAKAGGHVILWKSMHVDAELQESTAAQKALNCTFSSAHVYDLGGDWGKRQLLIFKKTGATPGEYPRIVGIPKQHPLV